MTKIPDPPRFPDAPFWNSWESPRPSGSPPPLFGLWWRHKSFKQAKNSQRAASLNNWKHEQPKSTEKTPDKTKQIRTDQVFYEKTIEMDTNQNIQNLVKTTVVVENLTIKDLGDINLHFLAHKSAEYFDFIACLSYQKDLKPLQLRNTPDNLKNPLDIVSNTR